MTRLRAVSILLKNPWGKTQNNRACALVSRTFVEFFLAFFHSWPAKNGSPPFDQSELLRTCRGDRQTQVDLRLPCRLECCDHHSLHTFCCWYFWWRVLAFLRILSLLSGLQWTSSTIRSILLLHDLRSRFCLRSFGISLLRRLYFVSSRNRWRHHTAALRTSSLRKKKLLSRWSLTRKFSMTQFRRTRKRLTRAATITSSRTTNSQSATEMAKEKQYGTTPYETLTWKLIQEWSS